MSGEDKKNLLFKALDDAKKVVALTGAGVSTSSGIPDFRSSGGFYSKKFGNLRVEELLDISFFMKHPDVFYKWAKTSWYILEDYKPNLLHKELAELEKCGKLNLGIFTQNIDSLHQEAGSREVYELHGSLRNAYCTNCGKAYTYKEISKIVNDNRLPSCSQCNGLIKPDIVFYGENLNEYVLKKAFISFEKADLALVMGSSLVVNPAAGLPMYTLYNGGKVIIVNRDETYLDGKAYLKFESLDEFALLLKEYIGN